MRTHWSNSVTDFGPSGAVKAQLRWDERLLRPYLRDILLTQSYFPLEFEKIFNMYDWHVVTASQLGTERIISSQKLVKNIDVFWMGEGNRSQWKFKGYYENYF